jgi:hypothetical protein
LRRSCFCSRSATYYLRWGADYSVLLLTPTAEDAPIDSRALCGALFDAYLGEDPVSDDGKRSIIAWFHGLIE